MTGRLLGGNIQMVRPFDRVLRVVSNVSSDAIRPLYLFVGTDEYSTYSNVVYSPNGDISTRYGGNIGSPFGPSLNIDASAEAYVRAIGVEDLGDNLFETNNAYRTEFERWLTRNHPAGDTSSFDCMFNGADDYCDGVNYFDYKLYEKTHTLLDGSERGARVDWVGGESKIGFVFNRWVEAIPTEFYQHGGWDACGPDCIPVEVGEITEAFDMQQFYYPKCRRFVSAKRQYIQVLMNEYTGAVGSFKTPITRDFKIRYRIVTETIDGGEYGCNLSAASVSYGSELVLDLFPERTEAVAVPDVLKKYPKVYVRAYCTFRQEDAYGDTVNLIELYPNFAGSWGEANWIDNALPGEWTRTVRTDSDSDCFYTGVYAKTQLVEYTWRGDPVFSPLPNIDLTVNGVTKASNELAYAEFHLPNGSYTLHMTAPAGYAAASYPFAGDSFSFVITQHQYPYVFVASVQFTLVKLKTIQGTLIVNANFDWIPDYNAPGEFPVLPGVTVTLTGDINGDGVDESIDVVTDENGVYEFTGIFPGIYTVEASFSDAYKDDTRSLVLDVGMVDKIGFFHPAIPIED